MAHVTLLKNLKPIKNKKRIDLPVCRYIVYESLSPLCTNILLLRALNAMPRVS